MSAEPRFLIYSLTKTFIAAIFCRLADRSELSLDDPVSTWIDDPRLPDVSLRELPAASSPLSSARSPGRSE